jgi:hypothetical protein
MSLDLECSSCGRKLRVPESALGKKVRCPGCKKTFTVPAAFCIEQEAQPEVPVVRKAQQPTVLEPEGIDPQFGERFVEEDRIETIPVAEEQIPEVEAAGKRPGRPRKKRFIATGKTGEVELLENSVVIRRKGFLTFMVQGWQGDKEIFLSAITGIELRKGNWTTLGRGFIRFLYMGANDRHPQLLLVRRENDPAYDENAVVFAGHAYGDFADLKEAIERRMRERVGGLPRPASVADELHKLAELLGRGLLTRAEFEGKKRSLLDR